MIGIHPRILSASVRVIMLLLFAWPVQAEPNAEQGEQQISKGDSIACPLEDAREVVRKKNRNFRRWFFSKILRIDDHVFIVTRRENREPPKGARGVDLVDFRYNEERKTWEAHVDYPDYAPFCEGDYWIRRDDSLTQDTRVLAVGDGWILAIYRDDQLIHLTEPELEGELHWRLVKDLMLKVPHGYYEQGSGSNGSSRRSSVRNRANRRPNRHQPRRVRPRSRVQRRR